MEVDLYPDPPRGYFLQSNWRLIERWIKGKARTRASTSAEVCATPHYYYEMQCQVRVQQARRLCNVGGKPPGRIMACHQVHSPREEPDLWPCRADLSRWSRWKLQLLAWLGFRQSTESSGSAGCIARLHRSRVAHLGS